MNRKGRRKFRKQPEKSLQGSFYSHCKYSTPKVHRPLKGRLTIASFALTMVGRSPATLVERLPTTLLTMGYVCIYNAGFYRPDHDPPRSLSRVLVVL